MANQHHPPRLANRLLQALLPAGQQEAVLGDLDEIYYHRLAEAGSRAARWSYWVETLRSAPILALRKLRTPNSWLVFTTGQVLVQPGWRSGLFSLLLLMPFLIHGIPFWIARNLHSAIGYDLVLKPLIYEYDLGHIVLRLWPNVTGIALAALLNLLGLISITIRSKGDHRKADMRFYFHLQPLAILAFVLVLAIPWFRYMIFINTQ